MTPEELKQKKNVLLALMSDPMYKPMRIREIAVFLDVPKSRRGELEETLNALVLREVRYKEADRILTLLTDTEGKITARARGALRKSTRSAAACPGGGDGPGCVYRQGEYPRSAERGYGPHFCGAGTAFPERRGRGSGDRKACQ